MLAVMQEGLMSEEEREAFWRAVQLCLNKFHSHWPEQAEEATRAYRDSLPSLMADPTLIYREEPFYVASAIADEELPLMEYREEYAEILRETGLAG